MDSFEKKLPITEEDVKNILRSRKQLLNQIHDKMYSINRDISMKNDIIEMVSFGSSALSDMPKGKGEHHDLSNTYLRYIKTLEDEQETFKEILINLILKERKIERVWLSYRILEDPFYSIIENLYVNNEKFEMAVIISGLSTRAFNKYRARGIELIIKFYNSDLSVEKLMQMDQKAEIRRKETKDRKEMVLPENYQLDIQDYLKDEQEI